MADLREQETEPLEKPIREPIEEATQGEPEDNRDKKTEEKTADETLSSSISLPPKEGKSVLKTTLKGTPFYMLSNIVPKLTGVFTAPIFTRILSTADYGLTNLFTAFNSVYSVILGLNLQSAVTLSFFEKNKTPEETRENVRKSISTNLTVIILWAVFTWVVVLAVLPRIEKLMEYPRWAILASCITSLFTALFQYRLNVWRNTHQAIPYFTYNLAKNVSMAIFGILAIVILRLGVVGQIWSIVLVTVMFTSYMIYGLIREYNIKLEIDFEVLKNSLKISLPLLPHSLSNWVTGLFDRFLMAGMKGLSATGIYSVAYLLGHSIGYVDTGFDQAWTPFVYKVFSRDEPHLDKKIVSYYKYYEIIINWLALLLGLMGTELITIFASAKYHSGGRIIPIITLSYIFFGGYKIFITPVMYEKKTYILPFITVTSAVINIISNLLLIPKYGGVGAAFSTMFAYLFMFIAMSVVSYRIRPMPWGIRFFIPMMLCAVISLLQFYIGFNIWIRLLILLLFTPLCLSSLVLDFGERKEMKEIMTKIKKGIQEKKSIKKIFARIIEEEGL